MNEAVHLSTEPVAAAEATEATEPTFDFASDYSGNLPALLKALNVSVLMTSYQAAVW